jgi:hypothetical protein
MSEFENIESLEYFVEQIELLENITKLKKQAVYKKYYKQSRQVKMLQQKENPEVEIAKRQTKAFVKQVSRMIEPSEAELIAFIKMTPDLISETIECLEMVADQRKQRGKEALITVQNNDSFENSVSMRDTIASLLVMNVEQLKIAKDVLVKKHDDIMAFIKCCNADSFHANIEQHTNEERLLKLSRLANDEIIASKKRRRESTENSDASPGFTFAARSTTPTSVASRNTTPTNVPEENNDSRGGFMSRFL